MGISLESLQRFVAIGQSAQQAVDQAVRAALQAQPIAAFKFLPDDAVDRAILERLPIVVQANYRQQDRWDALMTRTRLRTCGSILEAVCLEINAELLRERRAGR
jgi:hypothetical protein